MPDIVITPNRGTSNNPKIDFTGTSAGTIKLEVLGDGSIAWNGANGSLFGISDSLSGSLMSVNDISGLPAFEVFSDNRVIVGQFGANLLLGKTTSSSNGRLQLANHTTAAGGIGIGTDINLYRNAAGSLSVASSANPTQFRVSTTTAGGYSQIYLSNPTRDFILTNNAGDSLLSFNYSGANRLQFDTSNQWFNSGNVGIGTTSPGEKLTVVGNAAISNGIVSNSANDADNMTGGVSMWSSPSATTSLSLFKSWNSIFGRTNTLMTNGYATYHIMDTAGRGWVWRYATGGSAGTNVASLRNDTGQMSLGTAWDWSGGYHAQLNIAAGQGSATTYRDIDMHGSWSAGEGHAITATHAGGASNIVGQIVFQHDNPGSRIKFGRLYHSADRSGYPLELISTGADVANLILNNGNVGLGVTGPTHKLHFGAGSFIGLPPSFSFVPSSWTRGSSGIIMAGSNNADGSGWSYGGRIVEVDEGDGLNIAFDVNYVNSWTNNAMVISGRAGKLGNVGIGTTSPSYRLHVEGDSYSSTGFYVRNSAATFIGSVNNMSGISVNGTSYDTFIVSGGNQTITVKSGGNVGIGTTTPQTKLDIFTGANNTFAASFGHNIGAGSFSGFSFGYQEQGNLNYRKSAWVFERTDGHGQGNNASGKIHLLLRNDGASSAISLTDSVMTIDSDASGTRSSVRVGIGNTSPSYKLHVSGDIYANGGWFRVSSSSGIYWETYGGGWYMNDSTWLRAYNDKAIITNNEIRGTIFVDANDTGYYVNPATGTNLNGTLVNNGGTAMTGGWNRNLLLSSTFPVIVFNSNSTKYSGIGVDYSNTAAGMYFWVNGSSADISGTATVALGLNTGNYVTAYGSFRAPIFYDSDNTGYYCDPASTSRFSTVDFGTSGYYIGAGDWGMRHTTPYGWIQFGPANATWAHIYASQSIYFNTNTYVNGNWMLYENTWQNGKYFETSGVIYSQASMRAPIFYDYNDTNYYIDPASTSRVNTISFVSGSTFGPYFQYGNVAQNLRLQGGAGSEIGISGYDFNGNWRFQLYGQSGAYGFLNGNWAGWDLQKNVSGNLYLNNQTTYYIGTSEIYYNRVYGLADIRSPIFYDNDNTGYYIDPSGSANIAGQIYVGGWFRNYGNQGIYNESYGNHWYATGNDYWNLAGNNASNIGIILRSGGHQGTIRGYVYADSSNNVGFLNNGGAWRLRVVDGDYVLADGSSIRGQLFYDSNNTNFYVDPASLGSTASIVSGRFNISGNHNYSSLRVYLPSANNGGGTGTVSLQMWCSEPGNTWDGAGFGYNVDNNDNNGGSAPAYYFGRVNTSLGQSYMRFLSGGDWYFYNTNTSGTRTLSLGLGSDGIFYAYNHIRTPYIYDSNNTAYYFDGNNTSVMNLVTVNSLGVGTSVSGTTGEIRATNNITAYYSDERLKTRLGKIEDPIAKVKSLSGFYFEANETAVALGYDKKREVGVSAQEVQAVLPEIIAPAPISDKYMTVRYEKLIPLLIEAIKEQQTQIEQLSNELKSLKNKL